MRCYWYIIDYLFISFVLLFRSYFILLRGIETTLSIYCSLSIPELWISAYEQVPSKLATLRAGPISSPSRCAASNCEEKSGVNKPKRAKSRFVKTCHNMPQHCQTFTSRYHYFICGLNVQSEGNRIAFSVGIFSLP